MRVSPLAFWSWKLELESRLFFIFCVCRGSSENEQQFHFKLFFFISLLNSLFAFCEVMLLLEIWACFFSVGLLSNELYCLV